MTGTQLASVDTPVSGVAVARDRRTSVLPVPLTGAVLLGVVLRLVWSVRNGPSFDESFSAMT